MKRSTTKRALISSVLALVMCFGMLTGTTFAWFTDTVTSGSNIIAAGNLDVELYHSDSKVTDEVVGSSTTLFDDVDSDLWEPGAMAYEILTVANKGSLALKYQLTLNAISATIIDGVSFATMLKVAVVEDGFADNFDRASVEAIPAEKWQSLETFTLDGELESTESDVYGIIIWWQPSDNDNLFNMNNGNQGKTVSVDVGVVLNATQLSSESDAFGNDYDEDATFPGDKAVVDGNATESTVVNSGAASVQIPVGAEGGSYELVVSKPETTIDAEGNTTVTMDITLNKDGAVVADNGTEYTVTVNIGAGLNLTKVVHAGVEIPATDYTYDIVTGDVTFKTTHFSPFSFTYNNGADVATLDELLAALATDTRVINLKNDIEASEVVLIGRSVMINGNGYKVTSNATRVFRVTTNDVDVILNDVNMVSTAVRVGSNDVRGISIDIVENVKLTLNNCTVDFTDASANDWAYAVNVTGGANHTVTVNGGAYEGANVINVRSAKSAVTVKNATLTSTYPNTEAYIDLNYFGACIYVLANQGTSVYASGNTYIGDNAVAHNLGVGNFLEEGDNVDNTTTLAVDARIGGAIYDTLAKAVAAANAGDKVVLIRDIVLDETVVIPEDKTITLDLNGNTISGTCNAGQGHLFMVNNGAKLTVLDSSEAQTGKITFAQGTSNTGWAIDLEGELVLESGTIELTGDSWSIGYAVDVRPNAWGTAYQYPTVFTMNGGKIVSSDGAIRVASSSSESYTGVSAKFVMNGGEIEAAWDGIFIQQSNAAYDILTVELNGGKIASALSPVRVYGPVATSVVGGAEKPMTLKIGAAAELSVIGEIDTTRTWYKNGVVVLGGGMTVEALEQYSTIVIAE